MRYALSDREWDIIQPILLAKPRGIPRVDDRRVINGILWVLKTCRAQTRLSPVDGIILGSF